MVRKLTTSYYDNPVIVLISYNEKISLEKKKTLFNAVRSIGFTDSAVMVILPEYPGTKLKDSIKQVCSDKHVESVLQMNFMESSDENFMRISIGNAIKRWRQVTNSITMFIHDTTRQILERLNKSLTDELKNILEWKLKLVYTQDFNTTMEFVEFEESVPFLLKGISKNPLFLFNLTLYPSPYQHFANALEREWQVFRNALNKVKCSLAEKNVNQINK